MENMVTSIKSYDYLIVGGGIVGLAVAYALIKKKPDSSICVIEKESTFGAHQSTHNSGVLHAGLYYKPGSFKARLSVEGIQLMTDFCRKHSIKHEICGKTVIATTEAEVTRLNGLYQRGKANGLKGLRYLSGEQIKEIEPHASGIKAIHVPQEGIVDYQGVIQKLTELLVLDGVDLVNNCQFSSSKEKNSDLEVETTKGSFSTKYLINCGGLYSDRIAKKSGLNSNVKIIAFRGEYFNLKNESKHLVKNLIYPVPDPSFPFLGVHFTRMINGNIEAGPNAVLAFSREGYKITDFNLKDFFEAVTYQGLWRFLAKYPAISLYEFYRSMNKKEFTRSLQKLIPSIEEKDLVSAGSGVRAQAMHSNGTLEQDFYFKESSKMLHVINAPSPAATSSLAIGNVIASKVTQ
jgi:L-2-hydroxyglutarate oxidase